MRDSDRKSNVIDQLLQIVFEEVLVRRIAAAGITQHQKGLSVGITLLADAFPKPAEAVAGEFAGLVAEADVDVPQVASHVVNAMRDHHTGGPTGKVMIERLKSSLGPHAARAKELSQMLFGLGIDGKHGFARFQRLRLPIGDATKL